MNWNYIKTTILANNHRALNDLLENPDFLKADEQLLFKTAILMRKKHFYPECLRIIELLESMLRGNLLIDVRYLKADVYLDIEKFQDAVVCYSLILTNKETEAAYNNRGLAYWSLHQYDKALGDYKRALVINPSNAISYRGAGEMCLKLELSDEAISYFEKAINIDPNYIDALVGLGIALYQTKQWEKSYETFLTARKLDPLNNLANRCIRAIDQYFDLTHNP